MGTFQFNHTVTKNGTGYAVFNSYGAITVPENYRLNSVPLTWSIGIAGSTGSTTNSGQQLLYKTDGTQSENKVITTALNTNYTSNLILTNATIVKFMFQTYFVVGSGASYGQRIWYCLLKLPFGGINSETIITAAKLNEVADALNSNNKVTAGDFLVRSAWQTLADNYSINFNNTQPQFADLNALLEEIPATWEISGDNVEW